jgi:succinate-acetate transporter protein
MTPIGDGRTHTGNGRGNGDLRAATRIVLQPIAAPSILGLFGFAGATFIVAAHLAGWYGTTESPAFLFPFAAMFGGLAQFTAGMWSYRARDGLATAMHGMWGSFWLAYGILNLLVAVGVYKLPTGSFPELGYWFLALGVITAIGTLAAVAESFGLTVVLGALATGSGFLAVHYLTGVHWWEVAGGWILVGSAIAATYTAGAMLLESTWGRVVLPLGKVTHKEANVPGRRFTEPIQFEHAEPGIRMGQ